MKKKAYEDMAFNFEKMRQQEAEEIANHWKYDGIYAFYDVSADAEDYAEFMDPSKRGDTFFSCYANSKLIGYYAVNILEGRKAELGFGLKPEHTGKGIGLGFVNAIMEHVVSMHHVNHFVLSVALFNQRAIMVYKAAGFVETETFTQTTNGGEYEFLRMEKDVRVSCDVYHLHVLHKQYRL